MSPGAGSSYVAGFQRTCCGYRNLEASSAGREVPACHSAPGPGYVHCTTGSNARAEIGVMVGPRWDNPARRRHRYLLSSLAWVLRRVVFLFSLSIPFATFLPFRNSVVPAFRPSPSPDLARRSCLLVFGSTDTPHPPFHPWPYVIHTRTWPGNPEIRQPNTSHPAFPSHPHLTVFIATFDQRRLINPARSEELREPEIPPASSCLSFPVVSSGFFETGKPPTFRVVFFA